MLRRAPLLLFAALVHAAAPLAAQGGTAPGAAPPAPPTPVPAPGSPASAITLQPGDIIRLQVYREPDLTGDYLVDEAGVATLPLLGERTVTNVPVRALRDQLTQAFQTVLRNPSINIIPLRRVNVLGEVNHPGVYPLDPTVSLAGALATAGGATPLGDLRKVRIVRNGRVLRERVGVGETLSSAEIRSGDIVLVERRSWFERNSTFVVSALLTVSSLISSIVIATSRSK